MSQHRSARLLAGVLGTAGVLHFLRPKPFDGIVPRSLPGSARTWTYLSGAAELGCAAAVAHPRTRRTGGALAAVLFAAVFPANVRMAVDWRRKPLGLRLIAYLRLPLQIPLVAWALRVRRGPSADPGGVREATRRFTMPRCRSSSTPLMPWVGGDTSSPTSRCAVPGSPR